MHGDLERRHVQQEPPVERHQPPEQIGEKAEKKAGAGIMLVHGGCLAGAAAARSHERLRIVAWSRTTGSFPPPFTGEVPSERQRARRRGEPSLAPPLLLLP